MVTWSMKLEGGEDAELICGAGNWDIIRKTGVFDILSRALEVVPVVHTSL